MTQQRVHFTKMHGLGNDFVVINSFSEPVSIKQLPIQQVGDRHIGIGFDQLLVIEPSKRADFFCRIFNSDGSEAEQCGNGLRCVARFIHEEGLLAQTSFTLETKAGIFPVSIADYDNISVTMGAPLIKNTLLEVILHPNQPSIPLSILSVGNPHAILKVASVATVSTQQLGPAISLHDYFPEGANVGFMEVVNPQHIRLRTYERGAGETLACGSNACAAAVAGIANGWLQAQVTVDFRHGSLLIDWKGEKQPIHMTGPATRVYSGELHF